MADDLGTAIAFTASRELDDRARDGVVLNVLVTAVPHADRYVTGACTGGDAFIGRWLYLNRPHAQHVVIVPADRSRVDPWWLEVAGPVAVVEMPPGSTYADRNARLVAEGTCVFGFPAYPEDDPRSQRSGTWQTIRMARRAGKLSQWHCLTPPYRGRIERYPRFFLADAAGHSYPGIHVVYCRTCKRAWYDGDGCGCTCTDSSDAHYEDWVTDPASVPEGAVGLMVGRQYLDPGDRLVGRYSPPRRCRIITQWATGRPGGGPRNVAVRYLDNGHEAVIPFPRRLRKIPA